VRVYKGSFNFTFSGYYKNWEDRFYIPNVGDTSAEFASELATIEKNYFTPKLRTTEDDLRLIRAQLEKIIVSTRENWDTLMREYNEKAKAKTDRSLLRHGITI